MKDEEKTKADEASKVAAADQAAEEDKEKTEAQAKKEEVAARLKSEAEAKEKGKKNAHKINNRKNKNELKGKAGDFVWKADTKRNGERFFCGEVCKLKGADLKKAKAQGIVVAAEDFKGKILGRHAGIQYR
jgi:hypothetical protein